MTTAATKLTGLIGYPVAHSLSPVIHTAAIEATGVDAVYVPFAIIPEQVKAALEGLILAGVWGLNATIPHKYAAYTFADYHTKEAQGVGVANTLFWKDDQLWADNTDVTALVEVLSKAGIYAHDWIEIVGAGGAARAAAVAGAHLGAKVTCVARKSDKAAMIEGLARAQGGTHPDKQGVPKMVINATPLGRHGESLDTEHMNLGPGRIALDLNYEGNSPFLTSTHLHGGLALDGTAMLITQAELAFVRWFDVRPPSGIMRSALGHK